MCELTIITTYLIVAFSSIVLNMVAMLLRPPTSQVIDMSWTALSLLARWSHA